MKTQAIFCTGLALCLTTSVVQAEPQPIPVNSVPVNSAALLPSAWSDSPNETSIRLAGPVLSHDISETERMQLIAGSAPVTGSAPANRWIHPVTSSPALQLAQPVSQLAQPASILEGELLLSELPLGTLSETTESLEVKAVEQAQAPATVEPATATNGAKPAEQTPTSNAVRNTPTKSKPASSKTKSKATSNSKPQVPMGRWGPQTGAMQFFNNTGWTPVVGVNQPRQNNMQAVYASTSSGGLVTIAVPAEPVAPNGDVVPCSAVGCQGSGSCNSGCGCGNCGCGGCGSSGCGSGSCGSCGRASWSVGVDSMFMQRTGFSGKKPLISCACSHDNFKSTGFDTDEVVAAPRFRLYRHGQVTCNSQCGGCGSGCGGCGSCGCSSSCGDTCGGGCQSCCSYSRGPDFELVYYNLNDWNDKQNASGDLTLFGVDFLGIGSTATARYSSELQNLEANILKSCGCWTKLLCGVRWMQLDEFASVSGTGVNGTSHRTASVTNNFYGGHLGFQRLLYDYGGCFTLDSTLKGGVFANDMNRKVSGFGTSNLDKTGVSFIGDLEIQATFEVTCCWSLTAGYQMLWLTGTANAPDQLLQPDTINSGEFLFYHGANVGLVGTF